MYLLFPAFSEPSQRVASLFSRLFSSDAVFLHLGTLCEFVMRCLRPVFLSINSSVRTEATSSSCIHSAPAHALARSWGLLAPDGKVLNAAGSARLFCSTEMGAGRKPSGGRLGAWTLSKWPMAKSSTCAVPGLGLLGGRLPTLPCDTQGHILSQLPWRVPATRNHLDVLLTEARRPSLSSG